VYTVSDHSLRSLTSHDDLMDTLSEVGCRNDPRSGRSSCVPAEVQPSRCFSVNYVGKSILNQIVKTGSASKCPNRFSTAESINSCCENWIILCACIQKNFDCASGSRRSIPYNQIRKGIVVPVKNNNLWIPCSGLWSAVTIRVDIFSIGLNSSETCENRICVRTRIRIETNRSNFGTVDFFQTGNYQIIQPVSIPVANSW
jgi:hypothetical protein